MRLASCAFAVLLFASTSASASLVWGDSSKEGYPLTYWARGGNVTESTMALRNYAGQTVNVLMTCRQDGWFAYVGSSRDFRRGLSCGYTTKSAALYKARMECEHEGGSCDVERVGHDDGSSASNVVTNSVPNDIAGAPNEHSPFQTDVGVLMLQ